MFTRALKQTIVSRSKMAPGHLVIPLLNNPRVCIVGGGASGMCAGIKLKTELNNDNFVIYEAHGDFGGTWFANTYPGASCDILSHMYSFSFEQNPEWTCLNPDQKELFEYFSKIAIKYGLYSHAKFNTTVHAAKWIEESNQWLVTSGRAEDAEYVSNELFDFVINATGMLRIPNYPNEFNAFKEANMHSAVWDSCVSLEGKVVAVVGSGSSAAQIIPRIAEKVQNLLVFQRKPAWVLPRPLYRVPATVKWTFRTFPVFLWIWRCILFWVFELLYNISSTNRFNFIKPLIVKVSTYHLNSQVADENLRKELTPTFAIGCKRVLFTSDYYPALNRPNVKLIKEPIAQVRESSILTRDGMDYKIDVVLILATGFRVQDFFFPMKVTGLNGEDMLETWKKDGPSAYLGISTFSLPNYFILFGPNSALGHNSIIFMIECQVGWMIQVMREMQRRKSKCFQVKKSFEDEYMEDIKHKNASKSWGASSCGAWYTDKEGRVTTLYPDTCVTYYRQTRRVDFQKILLT